VKCNLKTVIVNVAKHAQSEDRLAAQVKVIAFVMMLSRTVKEFVGISLYNYPLFMIHYGFFAMTSDLLDRTFALNRAFAQATTLTQLFDSLREYAPEPAPDRVLLFSTTPDDPALTLRAAWDRQDDLTAPAGVRRDSSELPAFQFLTTNEPLVFETPDDPRLTNLDRAALHSAAIVSGLMLALRVQGQVMGALLIETRTAVHFDPLTVRFYEAAADTLALALHTLQNTEWMPYLSSLRHGVMSAVDLAYLATDLDGVIRTWGAGAAALYGYSDKEAIGQPLALLMRDVRQADIVARTQLMARVQNTLQQASHRMTRSGEMCDVHVASFPIFAAGKQMVAVGEIGFKMADVQHDDALQEAHDRLESILDSSNDALIMLDAEQRIVSANMQFERFFGASRYAIFGQRTDDMLLRSRANQVFAPQLLNLFVSLVGDLTQTVGGEFDLNTPELRTLVWYSAPVYANDGSILGRLFVFRDATQERQAERMKTDFVSLVSHELRTPLTSIKGFVDLLLDDHESGEIGKGAREYLEIVNFSTDRLLTLVNDIVDLTRLEAGHMEFHAQSVSLQSLLPRVILPLRPMIDQKRLTVGLEMSDDLPPVWADPNRLTQIITNLVANATKYTSPNDLIHITAAVVHSEDALPVRSLSALPLPLVVIGVHDNGMGISAADQPKLFTRFYRATEAVKQQLAGTGLGLFIVRSLVELSGGQVWVESEAGQGASFYFTLPIAERGLSA